MGVLVPGVTTTLVSFDIKLFNIAHIIWSLLLIFLVCLGAIEFNQGPYKKTACYDFLLC